MNTKMSMTLILATTLFTSFSQIKTPSEKPVINQCDELKNENEFLKKSLKINDAITTYSNSDIEIKLLSAIGNIKTQKIVIEYSITNKIEIRNFTIDGYQDKFVSLSGEQIPVSKGYSAYNLELYTNVPIRTKIELGPILPENSIIKFLTMKYIAKNPNSKPSLGLDYLTSIAEFRDIKVIWK